MVSASIDTVAKATQPGLSKPNPPARVPSKKKCDPRGRAIFAEAVEWIEGSDREWPFSYENICEALGLGATYVRRGLSRWRQQTTPAERRSARIASLGERRLIEDDVVSAASEDSAG
jgi:hypothetical protein